MQPDKTDKDLLLRIQKDEMTAFFYLYNRYKKRIFGFVLRYIKQLQDTEEIVQEVFIKIWEERNNINVNSSFESFLFTIAYNKTISVLRKKITENKHLSYLKSIQNPSISNNLTDEIYYKELNSKIQNLLEELTPQQKLIFKLSREDGLSHKEIADKLNIKINTVKKHIANTLKLLKTNIKK